MSVLLTRHNSDKLPLMVIPSSQKQQQQQNGNGNGNTYKTNQKFSDYYPMFTPPIVTNNGTPATVVVPDHHNHNSYHHHHISRSNSAASLRSVSTMQPQHPPAQTTAVLHSQRLPVKANIRDSQWIKENVLRNLQTRKPFAAAQSILNNNSNSSNNMNSAGTTTAESSIASNSLGSTTSNYNLVTTPSSTIKPDVLSSIRTPPSTIKLHPSLITHSNNNTRSSDTGATIKKVEFVDIIDQHQQQNGNNQSNMNSFQRLCELATRWNNKNRLVATQVIKLREKKYLSSSIAVMNENQNVKIKPKPRKRRLINREPINIEDNNDYVSVPAATTASTTTSSKRYSKIIGKNFIQLRPVNEIDSSFTNMHYAFSNDANVDKTHSSSIKQQQQQQQQRTAIPPLQTMSSIDSETGNTIKTTDVTLGENTITTATTNNNSIKWGINSKSINLHPLHVT